MAIGDYYWDNGSYSSEHDIALGDVFIDMTGSQPYKYNTDENSGRIEETSANITTITPISNPYSKARNGSFAFSFKTGVFRSDSYFPPATNSRFVFYAQQEDSPTNTVTKEVPAITGAFAFGVKLIGGLIHVFLEDYITEFILLQKFYPIGVFVEDGSAFGISWVTNGGDETPLSSDPANPSLPVIDFVISENLTNKNIDELVPCLIARIDYGELSNATTNPEVNYKNILDVVSRYGGGFASGLQGIVGNVTYT